ncbi:MAG: lactate utilization protein [Bacillota bacterium]|nr:lactate utilization protein [Bacillota bacterium]
MDKNVKAANKLKMEKIIKNLEKRNMMGYYCDSVDEAVEQIMALIPEESEVAWGGSITLGEIGIKEKLKEGNYQVNDPMSFTDPQQALEARRQALHSDVFLSSLNAITMDGEIVNIDGTGNRVAAIVFGPKKVILIAGANKVVLNEADAMDRIRNDACPPNCIRLDRKTPCALTGKCSECLIKGATVCCQLLTTRFSGIDDRIHVVLVNETLGY